MEREIREELGISSTIKKISNPIIIPLRGIDWALCYPVEDVISPENIGEGEQSEGALFVSPSEAKELANKPAGECIVSGWGKRMSLLIINALALYSPNKEYREKAKELLKEIM